MTCFYASNNTVTVYLDDYLSLTFLSESTLIDDLENDYLNDNKTVISKLNHVSNK